MTQLRYRKYTQLLYPDVNGIVYIIDGNDIGRLKIVKENIEALDKDLDAKMPIVFLVNKQDIEGCLTKTQVRDFVNLDRLDSNFVWTIK